MVEIVESEIIFEDTIIVMIIVIIIISSTSLFLLVWAEKLAHIVFIKEARHGELKQLR